MSGLCHNRRAMALNGSEKPYTVYAVGVNSILGLVLEDAGHNVESIPVPDDNEPFAPMLSRKRRAVVLIGASFSAVSRITTAFRDQGFKGAMKYMPPGILNNEHKSWLAEHGIEAFPVTADVDRILNSLRPRRPSKAR